VKQLVQLTASHADLAEMVLLSELTAQQTGCASALARCEALTQLSAAASTHPGDELLVLAEAATDPAALARVCPRVSLENLVASRLDMLRTLARQGDPAQAIVEATKIAGHPWFGATPIGGSASPAEVVSGAYVALLASRCGDDSCEEGIPVATLADAEAFYGQHRDVLGQQALIPLVGALRRVGSTCANCSLEATAEAAPLNLLDPDLGRWSDHGIYTSGTATGLAWHMNDVFIKKQKPPDVVAPVDEDGVTVALYVTSLSPPGGALADVQSLRLSAKMIALQGPSEGWRALWGMQVPGSDGQPIYLLVLWSPASGAGRWAIHVWQPSSGDRWVLPLPDGPLEQLVDLRVARGLDGTSYEVYWQGVLIAAGQDLPAPVDQVHLRFLVGVGAHAWIQSAAAEVTR